MMPGIDTMRKYGPAYVIRLDCGHVITRTKDEIRKQQLFIGKRIGCDACRRASGKLDDSSDVSGN